MIATVTFMSAVHHNEYITVEIDPTATQQEAIAKAEALLDNPENWYWAFCTTAQELAEPEINDVLDTIYHADGFTCTLVCLMSDGSVQSIERKVYEVEAEIPTKDFVDCPF